MKYSDEQRIRKIYEYAEKLLTYISDNNITKKKLVDEYAVQWQVTIHRFQ